MLYENCSYGNIIQVRIIKLGTMKYHAVMYYDSGDIPYHHSSIVILCDVCGLHMYMYIHQLPMSASMLK